MPGFQGGKNGVGLLGLAGQAGLNGDAAGKKIVIIGDDLLGEGAAGVAHFAQRQCTHSTACSAASAMQTLSTMMPTSVASSRQLRTGFGL